MNETKEQGSHLKNYEENNMKKNTANKGYLSSSHSHSNSYVDGSKYHKRENSKSKGERASYNNVNSSNKPRENIGSKIVKEAYRMPQHYYDKSLPKRYDFHGTVNSTKESKFESRSVGKMNHKNELSD